MASSRLLLKGRIILLLCRVCLKLQSLKLGGREWHGTDYVESTFSLLKIRDGRPCSTLTD